MNLIHDWRDIMVGDIILYGHIGESLIIGYAMWDKDYTNMDVNGISIQELVNNYTVIRVE